MTIAGCDKEIRGLIDDYSVVGLEAVMNAVVRATKDKPYMGKMEVHQLLEKCYEHEELWARQEEA